MKRGLLLIVALIVSSLSVYAVTCGNITSNTVLDSDLYISGTCFNVTVSNVVIDGNEHSISGDGTGNGVLVYGDNVTVQNFVINNFLWGVSLRESDGSKIMNNKINSIVNSGFCLHMLKSTSNEFLENIVNTSGRSAWGIAALYHSTNNLFSNNEVITSGYSAWGVYNSLSANNKFDSNKITTSGDWAYAMFFSSSPITYLVNNDIKTTGYRSFGVRLSKSSNSVASKNTINTFGDIARGIYLEVSQNVTLNKNKIKTRGVNAPEINLDPYSSLSVS